MSLALSLSLPLTLLVLSLSVSISPPLTLSVSLSLTHMFLDLLYLNTYKENQGKQIFVDDIVHLNLREIYYP